jgi:2-polyprenyl-6-methoxyphenol hydroxylase-like FAD-dependent oxidoreductase
VQTLERSPEMKVVIVGGGWSGCAAALVAKKQGAEVVLVERTDMLLGTGLVGGIMKDNGRFTAAEEMIAMGGGELFLLTDQNARHVNLEFPGHHHASTYNVGTMEPLVKRFLLEKDIEIHLMTRFEDAEMDGARIKAITAKRKGEEKVRLEADLFVDATGTAGPPPTAPSMETGVPCVCFDATLSVVG